MKNNKLENFPSVYYISLEESADRQKNLEKQFAEYGITPTAIISKRYSESDDEITGKFLDQMNGGTIGCAVSHIKAIRKWYEETDEEYAFFCEDDLSLETIQYWDFTWEEFIETIPEGSLYVQLLVIRDNYETFEIRKKLWDDWAATAYILTREYAKLLVDSYCRGEKKFHLEIPGVNNYAVPLVENILFETVNKGGSVIPLFVEDVKFATTFSPEEDKEVVGNQKGGHYESREIVLNYWKNKNKPFTINKKEHFQDFKMNQIEYLLAEYANDPENAENNLKLGAWYWNQKHTAPALSYFLRCAERAEDPHLAYEALLWAHLCYEMQGTRDLTARTLVQHALYVLPNRPEAYYFLARFHSKREQWSDTYLAATQGLTLSEKDLPPFRNDIGYPGTYGLLFEKAISGWWWGKNDESGLILKDLHENYRMQKEYRNLVLDNLQKYFPNLLVPSGFDWGNTNPEYAEMFSRENFIERTYEKHCCVKAGDIVIDAGANCGSFTHSILGKNPKQVYCVEPSNTLIHSLKKNVGHGPVTFINKAISDFESDSVVIADKGVYIYENDGNEYPTTTFKNIIEENNITRVDFLKIDCEGGEYSIFTKENYDFIIKNVGHCAGEWHINDHKDAIERFIEFRDLYLTKCNLLHVYERSGKEVTEHIFDDTYLYGFREYWKDTYLGQFIIYFTFNNSTEHSLDVVEVSESEKMDIVLQGKYNEYTDEIIDEYLRVPFVNNVIVSCWEDDRPDHYRSPKVKYVRSVYPLTPGTCNKNLQITTSFAGIKLCKTKFSAKMRSDQKYNYNSMMNMYEFLMENHTEGKIFVAGMFPSLLFHPRDHIYWGTTENLHQLFDIPLEYNSLIDKVRIGKYELAEYANYLTRPETYIGAHYCAKFDDGIKKMLIEPEKYLYDDAIHWQYAKDFSDRITPLMFKSFSRKCIDFDWTCKSGFTIQSYLDVCSWHGDNF
jgi:FkbM family methyltransferase